MSHPISETRTGRGMTPAEIALETLSVRPVTVRHLAGVLYGKGWSFTQSDTLAKETLAALVVAGKATRREVHGVDLFQISASQPMETVKEKK